MHVPPYLHGKLAPGPRDTLEPLRQVLARLSFPERDFPAVLITGTNGKGSTHAFLSTMLLEAGISIGGFTSPSLADFHEMLTLNGQHLSPLQGEALADQVLEAAGDEGLTLFEAATAMAFLAFSRARVRLAVVEVGWGGRRDSTNLCHPIVSILTHVALEHQAVLGETLEAIAEEKAGVGRAGRPLLTAARGVALQRLRSLQPRVGFELEVLDHDFHIHPERAGWSFTGRGEVLDALHLGLNGPHQARNAALALQAAHHLEAAGFSLSEPARRRGLAHTRLPGRFERLDAGTGFPIRVDAAHNPDGAEALARTLELEALPRPLYLILACYADKNVEGMVAALAPQVDGVVCTHTDAPRCMPADRLLERVRATLPDFPVLHQAPDPATALEQVRKLGAAGVIACGSLSLIEPLRAAARVV